MKNIDFLRQLHNNFFLNMDTCNCVSMVTGSVVIVTYSLLHQRVYIILGKLKQDADGAETTVYAALDPHLAGLSRGYFLRARDKARFPSREARYLYSLVLKLISEELPDQLN